ncbi:reverse transcriptase-like protein, partial [Actinobacillus pleuropneumoniae]|uniref:reverse transcriptase-like protein n=1 Tax=Actinobacillus pleuropneumoniae TaxID=715 RepID=UPI00227B1037
AQEAGCGGGAVLYLNELHCYKIQINLGRGTNNFAELCTAKHIIHFAIQKHCSHLQLFGDSKIVCNWLNDASHCYAFSLRHILDEAKRLITSFE